MPDNESDLREIREQLAHLTRRVWTLEQRLHIEAPRREPLAPKAEEPLPTPIPGHAREDEIAPPVERPVEPIEAPPIIAPTPPPATPIPPPVAPPTFGYAAESTSEPGREARPFEPTTDLESRIGSQWLNRIGIVATLIGVALFLKYAFENNWIGPLGRVSVALVIGLAIVLWSERFRSQGFTLFSYSLKAVGIGTMYLSVWAALQIYSLVPVTLAFTAMVAITTFTAVLALRQNALVLAVFALVGGFLTPVLLSTRQNREVELFSYVLLLDIATLALTSLRPWRRLLVGSFLGTLALYVAWFDTFYSIELRTTTIVFATLFFTVFLVAPLLARGNDTGANRVLRTFIYLPVLNAAVYFLQLWSMLEDSRKMLAGLAILLAGAYAALSQTAPRRGGSEFAQQILRGIYFGLAITFLTISIPLYFEGHWITLAWLIEAAALLWTAYRYEIGVIKVFGAVVLLFGLYHLLVVDQYTTARVIFNERFAMYLVGAAVLGWFAWLARGATTNAEQIGRTLALVGLNGLLVAAISRDVSDHYSRLAPQLQPADLTASRNFSLANTWLIYGAVLMYIGSRFRSVVMRLLAAFVMLMGIASLLIEVDYYTTRLIANPRFLTSLIAIGALACTAWLHRSRDDNDQTALSIALVSLNAIAVLALTLEVRDYFARATEMATAVRNSATALSFADVWLIYGAFLLYAAIRFKHVVLKIVGGILVVIGIVRLVTIGDYLAPSLLLNQRFITYLVAIGTLALGAWLLRDEGDEDERKALAIAVIALNVLALLALSLEVHDHYGRVYQATIAQSGVWPHDPARQFSYSAVWMVYGAGLMALGFWKRSAFFRWQALILVAITIVKVFTYDVSALNTGYRILSFIALGALLLAISFVYQRDWLKLSARKEP